MSVAAMLAELGRVELGETANGHSLVQVGGLGGPVFSGSSLTAAVTAAWVALRQK